MNRSNNYDIAVLGGGFSGALTALGLHKIGYRVILIEKDSHPRFAIGESSTPVADLILRNLADTYDLPWLRQISRYGSWQKHHPRIRCGLKRGFSYFNHRAGRPFQTDEAHKNELLVAASTNDEESDTNWFRSDVDAFIVDKVKEAGISYRDQTEITGLSRGNDGWKLKAVTEGLSPTLHCDWLIDATGSTAILDMLDIEGEYRSYKTDTSAVFSHFSNVMPWHRKLDTLTVSQKEYPYAPDHSAVHHLINEGWLWMLRFNHGLTSCGLVLNNRKLRDQPPDEKQMLWSGILTRYPSLQHLFRNSTFADEPGELIHIRKLQRGARRAAGNRWAALPHTAGFIDPLHSTGIAHSLSGVERILNAFGNRQDPPAKVQTSLYNYEQSLFEELDVIDLLVDGCYRAMDHFELFHIYTMLYFTAAITYEQRRINGEFIVGKHDFLSADQSGIQSTIRYSYDRLYSITEQDSASKNQIADFEQEVKKAIRPYNSAGLLNPGIPHIYHHTAANI